MNILKIAALLITTLLIVPVFTYYFGTPLDEREYLALKSVVYVNIGVILYCFIVGELTGNNSQVDKLWSLIPIVYAWIVADYGDYSPRLVLMTLLVAIWGFRLTYNFRDTGLFPSNFGKERKTIDGKFLEIKRSFNPGGNGLCLTCFLSPGIKIS
jgi:hypothetical protein